MLRTLNHVLSSSPAHRKPWSWQRVSYLIFSFFNDKHLLAPKYSEYFTWSTPPLLYSWSDSSIGCSAPLYSWSGSLIRSAYYFLYISFCFRLNKSLTNLTSLRQHHLQYKSSGLKTHPNLYLMEEEQHEVSSPAEKTTPQIPPTGAGCWSQLNPTKSWNAAPAIYRPWRLPKNKPKQHQQKVSIITFLPTFLHYPKIYSNIYLNKTLFFPFSWCTSRAEQRWSSGINQPPSCPHTTGGDAAPHVARPTRDGPQVFGPSLSANSCCCTSCPSHCASTTTNHDDKWPKPTANQHARQMGLSVINLWPHEVQRLLNRSGPKQIHRLHQHHQHDAPKPQQ